MATQNVINNTWDSITSTTTITSGTGVTITAGNLTVTAGNLALPTTSSTVGQILINSVPFLHAYGTSNIFLGGAGNFTASSASNIGVGSGSLVALTSGTGGNICLGTNTGNDITSAVNNILIGENSGQALTTQGSIIAIGKNSVSGACTVTTGVTAIGESALAGLTSGQYATAVGFQALAAMTSGDGNSALGYKAGAAITSTSFNTFVGSYCGYRYTSATATTAVGYESCSAAGANMDYQTALGYQTLYSATTGSSGNTAAGAYALKNITTGTYNIGIGCLSTSTGGGSALTGSDSGNIMIGNVGTAGDNAVTRIGTSQTTCYIAGIYGATAGATAKVALIDSVSKIAGLAGASGTVLIGGTAPSFSDSPTLTLVKSTTFDTNVAAAAVTLAGTTLAALGSDTDINITITPKGTATIVSAAVYSYAVGATNQAMYVDNTGKIGIVTSSRRFKENIQDLGEDSSPIMKLRPVSFNYKKDPDIKKFGLIAEEVNEILPSLVSYDNSGDPYTVNYNDLPVLILNELQKRDKLIDKLIERIEAISIAVV